VTLRCGFLFKGKKMNNTFAPYILHWKFESGSAYWKTFESKWEMDLFIDQCGLYSHPLIVKVEMKENEG
jgi:hypothetical protein